MPIRISVESNFLNPFFRHWSLTTGYHIAKSQISTERRSKIGIRKKSADEAIREDVTTAFLVQSEVLILQYSVSSLNKPNGNILQ